MHFVRQCLHTLWHLVSETRRLGPPSLYAQWVMERTIGNLGQEIRLHSNPYSNISQRGVLRASVNALFSKYPHLSTNDTSLPRGTVHLGKDYYLLRVPQDTKTHKMELPEVIAYANFALQMGYEVTDSVRRCGRIRLPNGQDVRSAWKEDLRPNGRTSRMVKVCNHKHYNTNLSPDTCISFTTEILSPRHLSLERCSFSSHLKLQIESVQ